MLFFGVITFVAFAVAHNLAPLLVPRLFDARRWTIVSQIIFYLITLLLIATLNGLYINHVDDLPFNWSNYWFIITRTVALGIIPITIFVLAVFNVRYRRMVKAADHLGRDIAALPTESSSEILELSTALKDETLILDSAVFLFAKANGNYVEMHNLHRKPELYRIKITDIEQRLSDTGHIARCHRSYIANLDKVVAVTGNAQGMKLQLVDTPDPIPVSRKYLVEVQSRLG